MPKRGRPPKGSESCTESVPVKMTPTEKADVTAAAEKRGITRSAWMREAAAEKLTRDVPQRSLL